MYTPSYTVPIKTGPGILSATLDSPPNQKKSGFPVLSQPNVAPQRHKVGKQILVHYMVVCILYSRYTLQEDMVWDMGKREPFEIILMCTYGLFQ